jgi:hypothetical protein
MIHQKILEGDLRIVCLLAASIYAASKTEFAINSLKSATDDENILGCESGDRVLPIYEKNRVQKSHGTDPLTAGKAGKFNVMICMEIFWRWVLHIVSWKKPELKYLMLLSF